MWEILSWALAGIPWLSRSSGADYCDQGSCGLINERPLQTELAAISNAESPWHTSG